MSAVEATRSRTGPGALWQCPWWQRSTVSRGQQLTLAHRRGWNEPLDAALAANAIDRATLDAIGNRADLPPDMASKAKSYGGPGAGR